MSAVEKEIEAVKFLLASFSLNPIEAERSKSIREKFGTNHYLPVYAKFSHEALQKQLEALQFERAVGGTYSHKSGKPGYILGLCMVHWLSSCFKALQGIGQEPFLDSTNQPVSQPQPQLLQIGSTCDNSQDLSRLSSKLAAGISSKSSSCSHSSNLFDDILIQDSSNNSNGLRRRGAPWFLFASFKQWILRVATTNSIKTLLKQLSFFLRTC